MIYELDTIYEAKIDVGMSCRRIYFLFSDNKLAGKCVSISECLYSVPGWDVYHIITATEVHHTCSEGTWILSLYPECNPKWSFRDKGGCLYTPTISLVNDELELKGRHYDHTIINDLIGFEKKEVKNEMYLQAIDVIFFNRKTKKVAYRELIVANDTEGAYMLAAQAFGKYDPKVHVKYAHCMFGFNEHNAEDDAKEED